MSEMKFLDDFHSIRLLSFWFSTSVCQARETPTVSDTSMMPTRRQISLAQAAQLIADAQFLMKASNGTSENPTQQSTADSSKVENVDSSPEAKTLLLQIKVK